MPMMLRAQPPQPNRLKQSRLDVTGVILGACVYMAQTMMCPMFLMTLLQQHTPTQHAAAHANPTCRCSAGTMRDYFDDFKPVLHVSAFRKVVEQVTQNQF